MASVGGDSFAGGERLFHHGYWEIESMKKNKC